MGRLPIAPLLAMLLAVRVAVAQHPNPEAGPAAPAPHAKPAKSDVAPSDDAATDKLIEELLTGESEVEDDLRWLYSDVEEYAPSDLVGRPIPAPGLPERGEGSRRTWDPRWKRFTLGNYISTGAALAIAAGGAALPKRENRWRRLGFDESVRDAIGIEDYEAGQWGRDVSDVGIALSVMQPVLVDSLIVTYWYRRSEDVAAQMALISAEAMGVASAIHGVVAGFSSRERPYGRNCGGSIPSELDDCEGAKRFRAFFSGHATLAFASAGVTCSHHARHDVFGNETADGVACGGAFVLAGVVGAARIVGDQHYATDVLAGAAVGTLSGLGVPWLLHYGPLARVQSGDGPRGVQLGLVPVANGVGIGGQF